MNADEASIDQLLRGAARRERARQTDPEFVRLVAAQLAAPRGVVHWLLPTVAGLIALLIAGTDLLLLGSTVGAYVGEAVRWLFEPSTLLLWLADATQSSAGEFQGASLPGWLAAGTLLALVAPQWLGSADS